MDLGRESSEIISPLLAMLPVEIFDVGGPAGTLAGTSGRRSDSTDSYDPVFPGAVSLFDVLTY